MYNFISRDQDAQSKMIKVLTAVPVRQGVIAGIVFEDTIRRICRVLGVAENGIKLDTLITELTNRDVLTALKAKRALAGAGLRTYAAHARWAEIDLGDVAQVIELTKELIGAQLE